MGFPEAVKAHSPSGSSADGRAASELGGQKDNAEEELVEFPGWWGTGRAILVGESKLPQSLMALGASRGDKYISQGLEPAFPFVAFAARIDPCPFKTSAHLDSFSRLSGCALIRF